MKESAVTFGRAGTLVGVLTEPAVSDGRPAVVLLNAGIVHRVGPSRVYVETARRLAAEGVPAFRFDFAGIGDSGPRADRLSFLEAALDETRQAMDVIGPRIGADRFVLLGICSGATFGFRTARLDPRVCGVVMINPQGHLHDEADTALTQRLREETLAAHYRRILWRSSFRRKVWLRGVRGAVDYREAVGRLLRRPARGSASKATGSVTVAGEARARLDGLLTRGVRLLEIHAEADEGLDYVAVTLQSDPRVLGQLSGLTFEVIAGANHTFTMVWSQEQLLANVVGWLRRSFES